MSAAHLVQLVIDFVTLIQKRSRSQWPSGLRPLACWDFGFESHWAHGCLSFASVVCRQAEISATGRYLAQGSPTDRGVYLRVIKKPRTSGGPGPRWAVSQKQTIYKRSYELRSNCYDIFSFRFLISCLLRPDVLLSTAFHSG